MYVIVYIGSYRGRNKDVFLRFTRPQLGCRECRDGKIELNDGQYDFFQYKVGVLRDFQDRNKYRDKYVKENGSYQNNRWTI